MEHTSKNSIGGKFSVVAPGNVTTSSIGKRITFSAYETLPSYVCNGTPLKEQCKNDANEDSNANLANESNEDVDDNLTNESECQRKKDRDVILDKSEHKSIKDRDEVSENQSCNEDVFAD